VEVDLADDRFDVAFDGSAVTTEEMLATIRELDSDYRPELVAFGAGSSPPADRIDSSALPEDLRTMLAEAKEREELLLVEFSGPG
jgi:hypothetical protein